MTDHHCSTASSLQSCIYSGHVRHRRHVPKSNAFRYQVFMMFVDLDEIPTLLDGYRGWSYERANIASFHRRDYFGNPERPLATAVREAVFEHLGVQLNGPIRLLTHFRYFGYCYNPVSFYYCYEPDGVTLRTIVAEITNTPWKERKAYFLDVNKSVHPMNDRFQWVFPKSFHVSPFMPMDVMYDWRFKVPGQNLNVHMINRIEGQKVFDATLNLSRQEWSQSMLNRVLLRYPFMTTKVFMGIHWQALRLWFKRVPFYEHPKWRKMTSEGKDHAG